MRLRPLVFPSLLGCLLLFGLGCRQPAYRTVQNTNSQPAATSSPTIPTITLTLPAIVTPPTQIEPATTTQTTTVSPQIAFLQRSLQRLANVKSFRAKIEVPTDTGLATGDIDFSRADGLYGILRLPNGTITELISTNNNKLYFRSNNGAWSELTGTTEGDAAASLLRSALSADGQLADGQLKDSARVISTANDPAGCLLYTVDQSEVVAPELLDICINGDMPVRLAAHTSRGLIVVRYRDFNKSITIKAPR